jgi:hypothetical protein
MRSFLTSVTAVVIAATVAAAAGAATGNDDGSLTGDWSGTSVCTPNHDACRDEQALYHLKGPNDRNIVTVTGSKVVDGREIVMGPPLDFRYDPEKKTMFFEGPFGTFRFTVTGTTMQGTLTLPSGELYRRISLKKEPKPA